MKYFRRKSWGGGTKRDKATWNKDVVVPVLSLVLAIATVMSNIVIAKINASRDVKLKQYEVAFKLKCDYYSEFQRGLSVSVRNLINDKNVFKSYKDNLEACFFKLEPFLSKKDRMDIKTEFMDYDNALDNLDMEIRDSATGNLKKKYHDNIDLLQKVVLEVGAREPLLIEHVYQSLFEE